MRTTLTLDPDVAALLKKVTASSSQNFKDVVNAALRVGLAVAAKPATPKKRFVQRVGSPAEFLVDITDNGAIQAVFDEEDFGDLSRREPPSVRD